MLDLQNLFFMIHKIPQLQLRLYAIKIAKYENAQLFCIHIITARIPYGYSSSIPTTDKSHADIKDKVEYWFDKVRQIAKNEGLPDVKTDALVDVKSVSESTLNYSTSEDIVNSHWNSGQNWTKKILDGK
jgi:hypothetical protein